MNLKKLKDFIIYDVICSILAIIFHLYMIFLEWNKNRVDRKIMNRLKNL